MDAQLKISEVAEKINSIETGGGEGKTTVPFKYVEYVECDGKKYYESPCQLNTDQWSTTEATVKIKEYCQLNYTSGISGFNKNSANAGDEITLTIKETNAEVACFYEMGEYRNSEMPDFIAAVPANMG